MVPVSAPNWSRIVFNSASISIPPAQNLTFGILLRIQSPISMVKDPTIPLERHTQNQRADRITRLRFSVDGHRRIVILGFATNLDDATLGQFWFACQPISNPGSGSSMISLCQGVVFRIIIWRNVSELFGVVSTLRYDASRRDTATNLPCGLSRIKHLRVGRASHSSRRSTLAIPRRSP
jgi:hypothetical protein